MRNFVGPAPAQSLRARFVVSVLIAASVQAKTESLIGCPCILSVVNDSGVIMNPCRLFSIFIAILLLTMLFTGLVSVSATAQTSSGPFSDNSTLNATSGAPDIAAAGTSTSTAKKYSRFSRR